MPSCACAQELQFAGLQSSVLWTVHPRSLWAEGKSAYTETLANEAHVDAYVNERGGNYHLGF